MQSLTAHPSRRAGELRSAPSGPDDWHRATGKRALTTGRPCHVRLARRQHTSTAIVIVQVLCVARVADSPPRLRGGGFVPMGD